MSIIMFYLVLTFLIALCTSLLIFIYKNDYLEEQIEKQIDVSNSYINNLRDAEKRITQRDILINNQQQKISKLKNKLTILEAYITSNNYGNAEIQIRKLKELVSDCESNNQF